MKELPVTFTSDGEQVVGMLHLPALRKKCPAVLFIHGFTGSRHETHRLFVLTARILARKGVASLRIDCRGSGDSAGEFSSMTVSREFEDARAALKFVRRRREIDAKRVGLLGMSMGGMVAALVMGRDRRIPAAVLWCPVADFNRLIVSKMTDETKKSFRAGRPADYGGWPVGKGFVTDGLKHRPVESLARSRAKILVLHGDRDDAVPVSESALYTNIARREIISGADHTFNSLAWVGQVTQSSARWLAEHLSSPARDRRGAS